MKTTKRTKQQKNGLITPHTSMLNASDATVRSGRKSYFLPEFGLSVEAASPEEAVAKAKEQRKNKVKEDHV